MRGRDLPSVVVRGRETLAQPGLRGFVSGTSSRNTGGDLSWFVSGLKSRNTGMGGDLRSDLVPGRERAGARATRAISLSPGGSLS